MTSAKSAYFSVVFKGKTARDLEGAATAVKPFLGSGPIFGPDSDMPLRITTWCHEDLGAYRAYSDYLVECIDANAQPSEILSYEGYCGLGCPDDPDEQAEKEDEYEGKRLHDQAEIDRLEGEIDALENPDGTSADRTPELSRALSKLEDDLYEKQEAILEADQAYDGHYLAKPSRDRHPY